MKANENYIYKIESYFEYKNNLDDHVIYFYNNRCIINDEPIPYTKVSKVTKFKDGLRISMIDKSLIEIPCETTIKRQVFNLFKNLSESTEIIDPSSIAGTVILQFGDLRFIVYLRNTSYEEFRKIMLKRIAYHFCPRFKENNIDLEHYDDFKFFAKDGEILLPIENSSDLGSALFHFNYRLNVYIKYKKKLN